MTASPGCDECDQIRLQEQVDLDKAREQQTLDLEKARQQQTLDLAKLDKQQELDLAKSDETDASAARKSESDLEVELRKQFHSTIIEVAKGGIERARDSAKYVQTAATAIMAVYTGVLALVFSVTDNPLPLRGAWAAVFLGLAIALATAYLAFITEPDGPNGYSGGTSVSEMQMYRTGYLVQWVNTTINSRRFALRAAVVSVAVGVAFIPAPFLSAGQKASIPDAPAPPDIPATIAPEISTQATQLIQDQVQNYRQAVSARNKAIAEAAKQSKTAVAKNDHWNALSAVMAALGLLLVFVGPLVYGWWRDP